MTQKERTLLLCSVVRCEPFRLFLTFAVPDAKDPASVTHQKCGSRQVTQTFLGSRGWTSSSTRHFPELCQKKRLRSAPALPKRLAGHRISSTACRISSLRLFLGHWLLGRAVLLMPEATRLVKSLAVPDFIQYPGDHDSWQLERWTVQPLERTV